jgi:hypothetical protein
MPMLESVRDIDEEMLATGSWVGLRHDTVDMHHVRRKTGSPPSRYNPTTPT